MIRGQRVHKESKGILAVPVLRVTEVNQVLWGLREFPALPVQEVPEVIQVR